MSTAISPEISRFGVPVRASRRAGRGWRAVLALCAAAALLGCNQNKQEAADTATSVIGRTAESGVAAEVNGQRIYVEDVRQLMIQAGDLKDNDEVDTTDPRFYLRLQMLIDTALMAEEATKRGLDQDPEVQHQLEMARNDVLAGIMQQSVRSGALDEATVEEEYRRLSAIVSQEQVVKLRHILFETREAAQAAKVRLDQGESFTQLALQLSRDRETFRDGGDMGVRPVENLIEGLRQLAATAPIGQAAGPVQSELGWHLVLVEERTARSPESLEQWRPIIQAYLADREERRVREDLRRSARINEMDFGEQGMTPLPGMEAPAAAATAPIGPGAVPMTSQSGPPAAASQAPATATATRPVAPPRPRPQTPPAAQPQTSTAAPAAQAPPRPRPATPPSTATGAGGGPTTPAPVARPPA